MPTPRAKALPPALLVGYVLPTILMFQPFQSIWTQQFMVALWQPSPLFVNAIWWLLPIVFPSKGSASAKRVSSNDKGHLKPVYLTATVISATVHIAVLATCLRSENAELSLWNVFVATKWEKRPMSQALHFIFQIDFWIIFAASILFCYVAIFDLTATRMIDVGMIKPIGLLTLCTVLLGPGAALSAFWYWREGRLSNTSGGFVRTTKGYR